MAKLPQLTRGIKGPPLRHASAPSTKQVDSAPSIMPRLVAMAGIAAIWSLVTITPLIASVGLQTQVDRPPIRAEDERQAVVRMWEPPTWEAQRAKFAPDRTPPVAGQPAYRLPWLADRWPADAWDSQRVRLTPIPDRHDPPAYSFPLLVDRWPQPDWPSQTSLKSPIPDRHDSAPFARPVLVNTWPQPEWPSQTTLKVNPYRIDSPVRKTRADHIALQWPALDWPSQITRKVPIPDAVQAAPPYVPELAAPIWMWPQPDWPSQTSLKSPIPDRHDSAPFARPVLVNTWPQPDWDTQQTRKTPIPDAVVVSVPPFSREASRPISLWPQPEWDSQTTRKTPIPDVHDAPPFGQRLWLMPVVALWEPGPPDPIVRRVVSVPLTPNLQRLFHDVDEGNWYMRLNATTHEIIRIT